MGFVGGPWVQLVLLSRVGSWWFCNQRSISCFGWALKTTIPSDPSSPNLQFTNERSSNNRMGHRERVSVRHRTNTKTNRMHQKPKWPHSTTTDSCECTSKTLGLPFSDRNALHLPRCHVSVWRVCFPYSHWQWVNGNFKSEGNRRFVIGWEDLIKTGAEYGYA